MPIQEDQEISQRRMKVILAVVSIEVTISVIIIVLMTLFFDRQSPIWLSWGWVNTIISAFALSIPAFWFWLWKTRDKQRELKFSELNSFYTHIENAANKNGQDSVRAVAIYSLQYYLFGINGDFFVKPTYKFIYGLLDEIRFCLDDFQKDPAFHFKVNHNLLDFFRFIDSVRKKRNQVFLTEIESIIKEGFKKKSFSGEQFERWDFSGFDFSRPEDSKIIIGDVSFYGCQFYCASFVNITFRNVIFDNCRLEMVYFKDCLFESCKFQNFTSLDYSFIENCNFIESSMFYCFRTHTKFIKTDTSKIKINEQTKTCSIIHESTWV